MGTQTERYVAPAVDTINLEDDKKRLSVSTGETLNGTHNNSRTDVTPLQEEESQYLSPIDRGAPGDAALTAMVQRNPDEVKISKRKSQFYSEVFAYREPMASPRERVSKDSIISAVVKTNVIIQDEYTFLTDLSSFLSARYQRPQSSILITLEHSSCLILGGTFDPAYHLTLAALPCLVQSTLNKRNSSLIQTFFADELKVPAHRGVVRFDAVAEENLATNGVTVLDEIERLRHTASKRVSGEVNGGGNAEGGLGRRATRKRASGIMGKEAKMSPPIGETLMECDEQSGSRSRSKSKTTAMEKKLTVLPKVPQGQNGAVPEENEDEVGELVARPARVRKIGRRKSLMQMFGR